VRPPVEHRTAAPIDDRYGQAELAAPDLAEALELAEQQGYPVRGRELLASPGARR